MVKHVIVKISKKVKLTNGSGIQCKKVIYNRIHQVHMKLLIFRHPNGSTLLKVPRRLQ